MKIILTGGGTAGHINPALSIAKSVMEKAPNSSILFIGKVHGMEENLVKKAGFDIKFIDIAGFNRKKIWKNLSLIRKIISAVRDSKKIIKNFAPDAVIGTGGYVCGPVLYAAKKMKIPTIIHESNAIPGVTTKITSKFATATCLGFEEAKKKAKICEKYRNNRKSGAPRTFQNWQIRSAKKVKA
jgi:UDP-N-acetylglucosamine--N-acetylmuramyl-(pentapeptide) pyrophosphoryl-undecaprenol N-acetylglucosamine transferase